MKSPLVSVIYPVYNDLPIHIQQSMNSIMNQDYTNIEIIIIDDSTNPDTVQTLNEYQSDHRVTIIRGEKRFGLPKALNAGLAVAKGEYIARADADDIQFPDRISTQISFLEENRSIGILGANVNYVDFDGNQMKVRIFPETDEEVRRYLHLRNPMCHSAAMIRKSVFDQIGFYNTGYMRSEDYELWFRASANKVKIYNLQKVLLDFRVANAVKRDKLNWQMTLKLKKQYFSTKYMFESLAGLLSVYLYVMAPMSVQNFIYKRLV